jgi:hypothetical protein
VFVVVSNQATDCFFVVLQHLFDNASATITQQKVLSLFVLLVPGRVSCLENARSLLRRKRCVEEAKGAFASIFLLAFPSLKTIVFKRPLMLYACSMG